MRASPPPSPSFASPCLRRSKLRYPLPRGERSGWRSYLIVFPLLLSACAPTPAAHPPPGQHPTLVSLNPCSDAVLAEVADPAQILAISSYSQNPVSSSMDLARARQMRATSGTVEEILELKPDLVIADQFLPPATAAALQRLAIPVERLPIASSVNESMTQVMRLAMIAGHPERGRALVARIDAALSRAAPPPSAAPVAAVVWQSGGIVPGPATLIGDLLRRTGFRNLSAARGMKQADVLALEEMLADPPQVILAAGNPLGNEDRLLAHPALAALKGTRRERFDHRLLWCGGGTIIRAAERLAEVRRQVPLLILGLAIALPLSLLAGRVWIDPFHSDARNAAIILFELRLPRAFLALAVGAGLGVAGAAMQGYLRNPLADPGLFGIAPGAALGAVLSLWLGAASVWALPLFALIGAAGAMALLALIAGRDSGVALFTLAGMMIASLAGALMSLAISLSPTPFALSEIVTWLMGALADRSWRDVWIAAPLTLAGLAALGLAGRSLDALTLGETAARSLGVDPRRLQWLMIAGIGLTVGAGVAVAGIIGFVGLVVPHLVRPFTDRRPSSIILPSALAGALLLLVADCLCRILPLAGGELRLGIALSLLGAPFFLVLLLRMRKGWV